MIKSLLKTSTNLLRPGLGSIMGAYASYLSSKHKKEDKNPEEKKKNKFMAKHERKN